MIRFKIDLTLKGQTAKRLGLNSIYTGKHWTKRQEDAELIHQLTIIAMRAQHIPAKLFNNPVHIKIYFNDNLDIDNHGYISKLIIDGIKGYLIADDTRKYINSLTQCFYDEDGILIELTEG